VLHLIAALALAAAGDPSNWKIKDTTDNLTAKRSVEASAVTNSKVGSDWVVGWVECKEGKTVFQLGWSKLPSKYVTVGAAKATADAVTELGPPTPWSVWHGETSSYIVSSPELARSIVQASEGASLILLTVFDYGDGKEAQFRTTGLKTAYDRVSRYCSSE
jgi:hypothetical protein